MGPQSCVYFVRAATGEVKIGVATDPWRRLASLQCGSPTPLSVLGTLPGHGVEQERQLHERFADHRLHGEWFAGDIVPDIEKLIQAELSYNLCPRCLVEKPDDVFEEESSICRDCLEAAALEISMQLGRVEAIAQEIRSAECRLAYLRRESDGVLQEARDVEASLDGADLARVKQLLPSPV